MANEAREISRSPGAILALGMVTPLGHGADATCAGLRAGLTRFAELPGIEVEGAPVIGAAVRGVTDGTLGLGRFVRLAAGAFRDLIDGAALTERELATAGVYLALPSEDRFGLDPRLGETIARRIGEWCEVSGLDAKTRVFPAGHAGVVIALVEAMKDLESRRIGRAVVGGVDSLVEPGTVAHYHERGRLKHGDRPVGVMPGEAAAFFLVEPLAAAEARGAAILATIEAPATAVEPVTVDKDGVCDASGLTDAARRTLGALPDGGASTGLVIGDLNGEPYRSEEYGYLVTRALSGVVQTPFRLWHPADAIGDTGAASAAVSIAAGARALARGYARTSDVLIFASSEAGLRGTVFLRKHDPSQRKG
jgi:3-oxoacyl-[acyl-carrier-protein] synthase-1